MARPAIVTEELAQLRNTRQVLFALAIGIEQRDRQLADQLARLATGQHELERRVDLAVDLMIQLAEAVQRDILTTDGYVVQANEVIRRLRDDIQQVRSHLPGEVAAAVGVTIGAVEDADTAPHAVEVGVGAHRRRATRREA